MFTKNEKFIETLRKLEYAAQKPLSAFKFFEEEIKEDENKINIMTMHKSKGDEFDYVFIPELSEKVLSIDTEKMKLKTSTLFMESVRGFNPKYKMKSEIELKEFSAEESMRLLYVAITRAKKKLYITTAIKSKTMYGKLIENEPNKIFEIL